MKNILTNVNYASKIKKHVRPNRGSLVFCLLSAFLLLCLLISPAAATVEWKISPSDPTVGDTLKIKGTASPEESLTAEISFEKEIPVSGGSYEYLLENIKVPKGKDNRFTVEANGVQNLNVNVQKWICIKLHSDASPEGVATISQANVPPFTYNILIAGDAGDVRCENSSVNLTFTASQTLTADSKGKFKYSYDTSSIPAGEFTIKIGDVEQTIELKYKEKPVAEFSASPTSGKVPLTVSFTDLSTGNATSWKWSFGDGTYSNKQNPVYTYSKEGTYTVSLVVKNDGGRDEATKCSYITVSAPQEPPVAEFSAAPTSGKVPLTVSFTDLSTGNATSWKWSFGDGTYSNKQNPVHTYSKEGTYTVSLKVKNDGGRDEATKCSYITVSAPQEPPVAEFSAAPISGKTPMTVSFTDLSTGNATSWKWSFGDGTYSNKQNPVNTYSKEGTYTVSLVVKNDGGRDEATKCSYITVSAPQEPPVAEFSAAPISGKTPMTVSFTDLSTGNATSWKWSFGDGTYSNKQNPVNTYSKEGTYTVSLVVKNDGGRDEATKCSYITVSAPQEPPVAKFSAAPISGKTPMTVSFTDLSTGNATSWRWSFGDGTYSNKQNPVNTYSKEGTYTVSLVVKNDGGRDEATKCSYITVSAPQEPPVAEFSAAPISGKTPMTVSFTDLSTGNATSWRWSFGDGTYSTKQNPVHTYNKAGKYTVSLKVKNDGGKDTETRSKYIIVSKRKRTS